jgi:hypothetical protein
MGIACSTCRERGSAYRVLVGKPEKRRVLGRLRHRWKNKIEIAFREAVCGCMDWIDLSQDRDRWRALVNAIMNLRVLQNAKNF